VPLEWVIEFKREVYQMALSELARYLPRANPHNRYLRGGMRPRGPGTGEAPRPTGFGDTDIAPLAGGPLHAGPITTSPAPLDLPPGPGTDPRRAEPHRPGAPDAGVKG